MSEVRNVHIKESLLLTPISITIGTPCLDLLERLPDMLDSKKGVCN